MKIMLLVGKYMGFKIIIAGKASWTQEGNGFKCSLVR